MYIIEDIYNDILTGGNSFLISKTEFLVIKGIVGISIIKLETSVNQFWQVEM